MDIYCFWLPALFTSSNFFHHRSQKHPILSHGQVILYNLSSYLEEKELFVLFNYFGEAFSKVLCFCFVFNAVFAAACAGDESERLSRSAKNT